MPPLILAILLSAPAADEDMLVSSLQKEFEVLMEHHPQAKELRKAEALLRQTNQSSHWTNYKKATEIIRKTQARAAVLLLLQYMVRHAELSTAHITLDEYAATISLLTGEKIESPYVAGENLPEVVRRKVEAHYKQWWLPNKQELLADTAKLTPAQLQVVLDRLLADAPWSSSSLGSGGGKETAYRIYHILFYDVLNPGHSSEGGWEPVALRSEMAPLLLGKAGCRAAGVPPMPEPPGEINYGVVQLLAELRKDLQAPQLDEIAADSGQPTVARLTSILAMYAAGEKLQTDALLEIVKSESRLGLRLVAIISLVRSHEKGKVADPLIALLDDRNTEIQTAAVCAMFGSKPPAAVPRLKEMIDELAPRQAISFALDLLGAIGTTPAKQALAEFLETGLEDSDKAEYVPDALGAFATATGERLYAAGAHDDAYYREKAREALAWWKSKQRGPEPLVLSRLERVEKELDVEDNAWTARRRITYLHESQVVLESLLELDSGGEPRAVTNMLFYGGQKVYVETSRGGQQAAFLSRTFPGSGAAIAQYGDLELEGLFVVLIDPADEVIGAFRRAPLGTLEPTDLSQFRKVRERFAGVQSLLSEGDDSN